ncbi:MAG: fibronectin type III domain-containing protein [Bdellovibrionales bacterium]|nr:fibronectin type III domain-containing protein [Bdellovibrionales bacterium]
MKVLTDKETVIDKFVLNLHFRTLAAALAVAIMLVSLGCKEDSSIDDAFSGDSSGDGLFGEVGNSAIGVSPVTWDFGPVPVNTTSSSKVFTLTNNASAGIYLTSVTSSSDNFSMLSTDCPLNNGLKLGSGSSCTVTIQFAPSDVGELSSAMGINFGSSIGSTEYSTFGSIEGVSTTNLSFAGIDSFDSVTSSSVRLNWTDVANENGYVYFRVEPGPTLVFLGSLPKDSTTVTVNGLSPSTSYDFRVRAIDYYGNYELNTNDANVTTKDPVVLTDITDRTFTSAAGPIVSGTTVSFDLDNVTEGNDSAISYTCFYDTVVDGSVGSASSCSSVTFITLDGSFSSNGRFDFNPSDDQSGKIYEIRVQGTDGGTPDNEIIVVNVASTYNRNGNLVFDYQADFAGITIAGGNSPFQNSWINLLSSGSSLDGDLSSGTWGTGWLGDGLGITTPHRLSFAGNSGATADRVVAGTGLNSLTQPTFTAWIKPQDTSTGKAIVFGNGGDGSSGWSLLQNDNGSYEFSVGSTTGGSSETAVTALSPTIYLKLEETSGSTAINSGSLAQDASYINSGSISNNQTGAYGSSKAYNITGSGYLRFDPRVDITDTYTIMVWAKFPLNHHSSWKTLVRGQNYHALLFQSGTNILGSYQGGFHSTGFDSDTLSAGWHHVAVVANGTNATFYVDGAQVGTPLSTIVQDDIYAVGNYQSGGQSMGDIDDFAYWPTALTPAQIQEVYEGGCSAQLEEDTWAHVAGYFDGSQSHLYKDGVLLCSADVTGLASGSASDFTLGARDDGSLAWNGEIAQVQVYSAGGATEISDNFSADSLRYSYPESCEDWYNLGSTTDGEYTISHSTLGNITVYCDQTTDGGGWMMVLNYLHQGGANPAVSLRTTSLPVVGSSTLGVDESGSSTTWGHAAPSLLSQFTYSETRFYCVSGSHSRIVDFKTTDSACKSYFESGSGSCSNIDSNYTLLPNHTGVGVPQLATGNFSNRGDEAMTNFPFYRAGNNHWGIRGNGNRWECDDFPGGSGEDTLHRVYVK